MKCPNCGAVMPAGSLYCEQCGEDIHIVPDFEPEVEFNIEQTIQGIAEDILEDESLSETPQDMDMEEEEGLGYRRWVFHAILVGVLCLIVMIGGVLIFQHNSLQFQLKRAEACVAGGQYDRAVRYYERALQLEDTGDDVNIKFALADVYFQKNNKIEYEYVLREIVKDPHATLEQISSAYGKLIAIYRAREDYESINELLLASDDEDVMRTYRNYLASAPEFSVAEGYYAELQPLKLSAYGVGKIYYTLDGTQPDENSPSYTVPIILDDGDYTVCAYFVNEFGVASEHVTKTYHVEIEELPIPEVSTVSGEYQFPVNIEIMGDSGEVYYTTDGSEPTLSSTLYVGPIPMPLGKSHFKFIRLEGNRTSSVVDRTFSLTMNTEYTPQQAEEDLVAYFVQSGKIYDEVGHFDDSGDTYKYQYQYVTNIDKIDDFYVFSEILCGADDTLTKTGSHFAVNAYTGKLYKLQIEGYNNYTLVAIEEQPMGTG